MLEQKNVQVKAGSSFQTICPFPIGYIYQSYTDTSPATIYGGTWTPITGRFLYCNNSTVAGGANSASHKHGLSGTGFAKIRYDFTNSPNIQMDRGVCEWSSATGALFEWNINQLGRYKEGALSTNDKNIAVGLIGDSNTTSISTMPAYQSCYTWRRTA